MSKVTSIDVQGCDNEIIIIASQTAGSSVICHLKSGYNAPVSYTVNPANILSSGSYYLTVIGINWGGSGSFKVAITGDSPVVLEGGGTEPGVAYSKTIPMMV